MRERPLLSSPQSSTDRRSRVSRSVFTAHNFYVPYQGGVHGLAGDLAATPVELGGRPGGGSALESAGTIICLRTRRESVSILSATFYKSDSMS